ncbi:RNA-directed DNA polymerase from mobile element jockey-like [Rhizophagus clarus]|uniref:RNA-directed DNA polymerase from mobile element jockey-like n=1 Tax=Rhizophagus clarus TaxID=94130 RepID=A0A8H3QLL1_9GLOM|nr:RNA-directed DNA polymerase from mobile element jockey-like [Rhizophagus clarus]
MNDQQEEILITDPTEIEKLVAEHFQKYNIDDEIYFLLIQPITLKELQTAVTDSSKGKAYGPICITYENLQILLPSFQEQLLDLFNSILRTQQIPSNWLKANIYPIPKPKSWQYQLNNTRPITLLELSRRASKKLTFKPLRIMNKIINYAKERNKDLCFLSLNILKAYDRVNTNDMHDAALKRIKIPEQIKCLIKNLFSDRYNWVFTSGDLIDKYKMITGIDQSEIISPLLWIIYYDPFLSKLRKMDLGKDIVEIKPITDNDTISVLGIWFNMNNNNKHIINTVQTEVGAMVKLLNKKKGLTDKMMLYVFNHLIIPIIEYRIQLTIIPEVTLNKLMAPFCITFKHKLQLAKTALNAILESNLLYNINNFIANQRQSKINNFIIQINNIGILKEIMDVRFMNIQEDLLLNNHPFTIALIKEYRNLAMIKKGKF